jgi:hypothetical protein
MERRAAAKARAVSQLSVGEVWPLYAQAADQARITRLLAGANRVMSVSVDAVADQPIPSEAPQNDSCAC